MSSFYIFDPDTLAKIVREELKKNKTTEELITNLVKTLDKKYPGRINLEQQWIFNVAGGAMGQLYALHVSLSEYLIIFGTPIGTEGFSGRYLADDYFMILEGEQWAYYPGNLTKLVFKPGELNHMPRGQAIGYRMPDRCYALEYARGWIPLMMPFGVADAFFSTLDFSTVAETLWVLGKGVVMNLLSGKI